MLTTLLTFTRLTYPCGSAAVQELLIQKKKKFHHFREALQMNYSKYVLGNKRFPSLADKYVNK